MNILQTHLSRCGRVALLLYISRHDLQTCCQASRNHSTTSRAGASRTCSRCRGGGWSTHWCPIYRCSTRASTAPLAATPRRCSATAPRSSCTCSSCTGRWRRPRPRRGRAALQRCRLRLLPSATFLTLTNSVTSPNNRQLQHHPQQRSVYTRKLASFQALAQCHCALMPGMVLTGATQMDHS